MGEAQARREEGFEVDDSVNGVPGVPPPPPRPDGAGSGSGAPPPPPATPDTGPQPGSWGSTPGWTAEDPSSQQWGLPSPSAPVGWERPAGGSNGCLKGCLIVGGLLVVLVVIAGIALA